MIRLATISECGKYRYRLSRFWGDPRGRVVLWVMLNPSTADADKDDPTIRRCIGYAKDWGYDGIMVGNLFAYRATKPGDLHAAGRAMVDIGGPENAEHMVAMTRDAALVVAAWGSHAGKYPSVHKLVAYYLRREKPLHALGFTKHGLPLHPLMQPSDLKPVEWAA